MFAEGFGNTGAPRSSRDTQPGFPFISAEELKKRKEAADHNTVADHFAEPPAQTPATPDLPPSSRTLGGFFRGDAGTSEEVKEVEERDIIEEKDLAGDGSDEDAYEQVIISGS